MTPTPSAEAYFRFLRLCAAIKQAPGHEQLDANHNALLESVALHCFMDQPLAVREAIDQAALGSPATLHKRLQRLIAQELITAQSTEQDRRTKHLVLTQKGLGHFAQLGAHLHKVQH